MPLSFDPTEDREYTEDQARELWTKARRMAEVGECNFRGWRFPEDPDLKLFGDNGFGRVSFYEANFIDAKFIGNIDFSNAYFRDVSFHHTNFSGDADFSHACFDIYADFRDASFKNISFRYATFNRNVNFSETCFSEKADFSDACFSEEINFQFKDVRITIFNSSHLQQANLIEANLSNADLREVFQPRWEGKTRRGKERRKRSPLRLLGYLPDWLARIIMRGRPFSFILDDTQIQNARFSSRSADPWTILRRSYSGPMFAIHLLLLVAFLLPLVSKAAIWVTVGRVEEAVIQNEKVQKLLEKVKPIQEKGAEITENATGKSLHWEETRVGWILVGWHSGMLLFGLALCGIAYNGLRFWLTYKIGLLRDREQQSDRSPGKDEYLGLFNLHIAASYLLCPLLLFFVMTFWNWVAQPVSILSAS